MSSTSLDLRDEREAVEAQLHRMRTAEFVGMEHFGSRPESAQHVSLDEVAQVDVYVGIIGGRYGSGITEQEYRKARELGIPRFFYVKSEAAITIRDDEPEKAQRLAAFRAEIADSFDGHVVTEFDAPEKLAAFVGADLHRWMFDRITAALQSAAVTGELSLIRAIAGAAVNQEALRDALVRAGIAAGDDVVDAVVALSPFVRKRLLAGLESLTTDYATRIDNFLTEYLGRPGEPVPFGGRSAVLASLDQWLHDPEASPYLLVAADAGRGKTATLVHWSRRLLSDASVEVIFVPVSIRFRTNLAQVTFTALAARLAALHGKELASDMNMSAEVWRGVVSDLLRKPLPSGKTLVVILDGLDEAADWEPGPDLFPLQPTAGLRLVVSARFTASMPDAQRWLEQLGWNRGTLARAMPLRPLTEEGVCDVVVSMGFPLAELGAKVDVVAQLHRLSGGDPLLVRLYVGDLWQRGVEATRLTPEDLAKIEPGLDGYFGRWWNDQEKLWGKTAPLREKGVRAILNLLSCAFAPLTSDDIVRLAPEDAELTSWTLPSFIEPLGRFIIETDAGYVLNHPRFAQYLYNEKMIRAERDRWNRRFIEWGKSVLAELGARTLSAADVPRYLVQYYSAHLERANAPADDLLALVTIGWRQAWETLDGGLTGFVRDIDLASRAVERIDDEDVAAGGPPSRFGDEIFCALCRASIRSLSQNIPAPLLMRLVVEGFWRPAQALAFARNIDNPYERAQALYAIASRSPEREREELLREVFALVDSLAEIHHLPSLAALARAGSDDAFERLKSFAMNGGSYRDALDTFLERRLAGEHSLPRALQLLREQAHPESITARVAYWAAIEGALDDARSIAPERVRDDLARVAQIAASFRAGESPSMDDARDSSWFSNVVFHLAVARGGVAARELAQFVLRTAPLMPETIRSSVRYMSDATDAIVFSDKSRIDNVNVALGHQEGAEAIVGPIIDRYIAGNALRESLIYHQVVHAVLEAGHVDLVVDAIEERWAAQPDDTFRALLESLPYVDPPTRSLYARRLLQLLERAAEERSDRGETIELEVLAESLPRDLFPQLMQFVRRIADHGLRLVARLSLVNAEELPSAVVQAVKALPMREFVLSAVVLLPRRMAGEVLLAYLHTGAIDLDDEGTFASAAVLAQKAEEPERGEIIRMCWERVARSPAMWRALLPFMPGPPQIELDWKQWRQDFPHAPKALLSWLATYAPESERAALVAAAIEAEGDLDDTFYEFSKQLTDDQLDAIARSKTFLNLPTVAWRSILLRHPENAASLLPESDAGRRIELASYVASDLRETIVAAIDADDLLGTEISGWISGMTYCPREHVDRVLDFVVSQLSNERIADIICRNIETTDDFGVARGGLFMLGQIVPRLAPNREAAWRIVRTILGANRRCIRGLLLLELAAVAPYLAQIGVSNATAVDAIDRASVVFP